MIVADQLSKSFGAVQAASALSFEGRDGAITGLLGPNGAGKTTAIRMLTGLLRPDSGEALIGGVSVHQSSGEARSLLGVVGDAPGLYARLTAHEHLLYSGRLHGLAESRLRASADRWLSALGMASIAHRRAAGFSQGERRKVALAQALIHDPAHLLLDEPTNGLDVPSARAVRRLLRELAGEGRCVMFSSHVMEEVAELCDRVVVVAGGRVVAAGTTTELMAQTGAATFEAAFVQLIGSEEGLW